jgi:hypothetical protein
MKLTGENRSTRGKSLSQCHFVHHKSYMDWLGIVVCIKIRQAANLPACLCSTSSPPIDPGKETLVPLDTLEPSRFARPRRATVRVQSPAGDYADLARSSGKRELPDNVIVIHERRAAREVNVSYVCEISEKDAWGRKLVTRPFHGSHRGGPGSILGCGICGGQSGAGTGFSPQVFEFSSVSFIPPVLHYLEKLKKLIIIFLFIFITGLHNKPQGCGASIASAAGPFTKKTSWREK